MKLILGSTRDSLGSVDMLILSSPAPFMGICALHCLGCFGLGSNIAYESSSSHELFVELSKFTHLSAYRLFLPVLCRRPCPW